jgi:two-component system, NarL family, sensor histidine kinase DegS
LNDLIARIGRFVREFQLLDRGICVPGGEHDNFEHFVHAALNAIKHLEKQMASLAEEVGNLNTQLTQQRTSVQQEREEMDIYYSLETGTQHIVQAPGTSELRARESDLLEATIRAGTLKRRLSDFVAVLSVSRRQFESDGELPDIDAATELAIRIAKIQAQEDERRRFARDIHDGPAQAFANAIIGLEFVERAIKVGADEASALSEIERIKGSLREGLTEIRRFMFDLKPSMLQDRGLVATVEHYTETYRSILPVNVQLIVGSDLRRLTPEQEMTAFRVIQESLHNATKYARASQVIIEIALQGDEYASISVCDDGRGFDPSQVTAHSMGGTGLKGMRERAELVGGTFRVESAPDSGCCIYLVLPFVHSQP